DGPIFETGDWDGSVSVPLPRVIRTIEKPTMKMSVLVLPGDGIGTEVTREAVRVLECVAAKFGHELTLREGLLGGVAIHKTGTPMPQETEALAHEADATLLGAVGLPEFDDAPPHLRPEKGL